MRRMRGRSGRLREERGTGLIGTTAGVLAFWLFLLVAAHVLVHLYATSVVTAAAFDAARAVSAYEGEQRRGDAEARARSLLGRWGRDVRLDFVRVDGEQVVLRVQAESPALLPRLWTGVTGIGRIDREIRIRTERPR